MLIVGRLSISPKRQVENATAISKWECQLIETLIDRCAQVIPKALLWLGCCQQDTTPRSKGHKGGAYHNRSSSRWWLDCVQDAGFSLITQSMAKYCKSNWIYLQEKANKTSLISGWKRSDRGALMEMRSDSIRWTKQNDRMSNARFFERRNE